MAEAKSDTVTLLSSEKKSESEQLLDDKIEIVKYVFNTKASIAQDRLTEKENRERKKQIMEIIADKENNALKNLSIEELKKML